MNCDELDALRTQNAMNQEVIADLLERLDNTEGTKELEKCKEELAKEKKLSADQANTLKDPIGDTEKICRKEIKRLTDKHDAEMEAVKEELRIAKEKAAKKSGFLKKQREDHNEAIKKLKEEQEAEIKRLNTAHYKEVAKLRESWSTSDFDSAGPSTPDGTEQPKRRTQCKQLVDQLNALRGAYADMEKQKDAKLANTIQEQQASIDEILRSHDAEEQTSWETCKELYDRLLQKQDEYDQLKTSWNNPAWTFIPTPPEPMSEPMSPLARPQGSYLPEVEVPKPLNLDKCQKDFKFMKSQLEAAQQELDHCRKGKAPVRDPPGPSGTQTDPIKPECVSQGTQTGPVSPECVSQGTQTDAGSNPEPVTQLNDPGLVMRLKQLNNEMEKQRDDFKKKYFAKQKALVDCKEEVSSLTAQCKASYLKDGEGNVKLFKAENALIKCEAELSGLKNQCAASDLRNGQKDADLAKAQAELKEAVEAKLRCEKQRSDLEKKVRNADAECQRETGDLRKKVEECKRQGFWQKVKNALGMGADPVKELEKANRKLADAQKKVENLQKEWDTCRNTRCMFRPSCPPCLIM